MVAVSLLLIINFYLHLVAQGAFLEGASKDTSLPFIKRIYLGKSLFLIQDSGYFMEFFPLLDLENFRNSRGVGVSLSGPNIKIYSSFIENQIFRISDDIYRYVKKDTLGNTFMRLQGRVKKFKESGYDWGTTITWFNLFNEKCAFYGGIGYLPNFSKAGEFFPLNYLPPYPYLGLKFLPYNGFYVSYNYIQFLTPERYAFLNSPEGRFAYSNAFLWNIGFSARRINAAIFMLKYIHKEINKLTFSEFFGIVPSSLLKKSLEFLFFNWDSVFDFHFSFTFGIMDGILRRNFTYMCLQWANSLNRNWLVKIALETFKSNIETDMVHTAFPIVSHTSNFFLFTYLWTSWKRLFLESWVSPQIYNVSGGFIVNHYYKFVFFIGYLNLYRERIYRIGIKTNLAFWDRIFFPLVF